MYCVQGTLPYRGEPISPGVIALGYIGDRIKLRAGSTQSRSRDYTNIWKWDTELCKGVIVDHLS